MFFIFYVYPIVSEVATNAFTESLLRPDALILTINKPCDIQSNTFDKSINTVPAYVYPTTAYFHQSINLRSTCSHPYLFYNHTPYN